MGKDLVIAYLTIVLIVAPVTVYFWLADMRDAREAKRRTQRRSEPS